MTSPWHSPDPGAAFDAFYRDTAPAALERVAWTPDSGPLPALYLSHGAPPLFDDAGWIGELFAWAERLPQPRAILVISAHWEAAPLRLSATGADTPLVYDFGGFPARFYTMTYPTPDASVLADQIAALMPSGEPLQRDRSRGLDHGTWVPLKVMYPYGDVPVLQLSIPTEDPVRLLELGRRLRPLRDSGVLIIGSGFMTHGLPFLGPEQFEHSTVPSWSREFDLWAAGALSSGDVDTLVDYRQRAPGMPYAHPTVEHFVPIFVTLGLGEDLSRPVETVIDDYWFGLAKRSFQVG